ncbi:MAG TPA: ABC transporter permease [Clostridia bacterium]|nr:ABC transporter permease [Clostridia bacterium]
MSRLKKRIAHLYASPKWSGLVIPLTTIMLSFLLVSILFLIIGRDPVKALYSFFQGAGLGLKPSYTKQGGMLTDFFSFLGILAPMLLAALGVVVGLKGGMFNIGISGQMLFSGFLATVLVGYSSLPPFIAVPLVLLIGIVAGGTLGAFIGWLKYRFNIHEVVSSIMLNYIVSYATGYVIKTKYVDPIIRSSRAIKPNARLMIGGVKLAGQTIDIPIGIVIALLCVFLIRFFLNRMTAGFEIKMVGLNKECAEYAGVRINRVTVRALVLSGMLAGLAGVTYYLGFYRTMTPKDLASLGFDSIAVAFLGNLNPVSCIFSSMLITIFQKGAVYMGSVTGIVREIASVITGILLLFSALGSYIKDIAVRYSQRFPLKPEDEASTEVER